LFPHIHGVVVSMYFWHSGHTMEIARFSKILK